VAPGPIEDGDEACLDRVIAGFEHDRNRGCDCFGGLRRRRAERGDYRHLPAHEIGPQLPESIKVTPGPGGFDSHISPVDISELGESLAKRFNQGRIRAGRTTMEKADYGRR